MKQYKILLGKGLLQLNCLINNITSCSSYLAPEYFMYGKVNDKIDVYAFGVVLLELFSGRKPISNHYPKGQESLVMWVCPFWSCDSSF